jgi:hypothetical protein
MLYAAGMNSKRRCHLNSGKKPGMWGEHEFFPNISNLIKTT